MRFSELMLLALGVSMDAAAVSAARGVAVPKLAVRHAVAVAVWFGGFQALMPLIGTFIGARASRAIAAWDHWVAFALLTVLGGKMLWEARVPIHAREPSNDDGFGARTMLLLAIATSIDALVVGITLPMLDARIGVAVATIGITTAACSVLGLVLGRRIGAALGPRLEMAGGLILIGLGVRTLVQHAWP